MSTWLIVIISVAGWLAISAVVARVAGRVEYRSKVVRGSEQRYSPVNDAQGAALSWAAFWPAALALAVVAAPFVVVVWLWSRSADSGIAAEQTAINARRARVDQLRSDAASWDAKRHTGTDAEREMAGELARLCRQQADDLESA